MPNTHHHQQQQQQQAGRTKHVSFARSHTLTSFDMNVNAGFRPSGRLRTASSQERLIGGKKPIIASGSMYETLQPTVPQSSTLPKTWLPPPVQLATCQHHHAPIHLHQPLPDNMLGLIIPQPLPMALPPPSPEVLIVEKKFRNAMKTQATQTDVAARRQAAGYSTQVLSLSPRPPHRVKVVSQGAQTNGLQNGKKLTKSLSEIPNGKDVQPYHYQQGMIYPHEMIYRTQSQDVTPLQTLSDAQNNIMYYKPPPPLLDPHSYGLGMEHLSRGRPSAAEQNVEYVNVNAAAVALNESFDYESNSLPRRACTSHARTETDYYSNSLPRRADTLHSHDMCKHITECVDLIPDNGIDLDFTRPHLLPPPSEYCKNDDDVEDVEEYYDDEEEEDGPSHPHETESYSSEVCMEQAARRMSMLPQMMDSPFRRDDLRRQSMPVYGQTEKLIDGFGPRTSFRRRDKVSCFPDDTQVGIGTRRDEQEIFIDFKPHVSPKPSPKLQVKHRKQHKAEIAMRKMQQQRMAQAAAHTLPKPKSVDVEVRKAELVPSDEDEEEDDTQDQDQEEEDEEEAESERNRTENDHPDDEEPIYENIIPCGCKVEPPQLPPPPLILEDIQDKRSQFRKRSVSLDDDYAAAAGIFPTPGPGLRLPSTPASPCREELLLANVSTYPSSDSLANDTTRDHSDGIWNESQVTVLTADQHISDGSYSSNLLLTPSSKRKNLLLQHQQRSSVDTDALDFEEQSPTYGLQTLPKIIKTPTPTTSRPASTLPLVPPPAIAVTPSSNQPLDSAITSPLPKRSMMPRGSVPDARQLMYPSGVGGKQRHSDASFLPMAGADYARSADISECSTNTDEYATCTDNSKRTPGIKTPPTTTSSSSATQVPVSTQSSQLEKTHAGSSFESASSLYSMREDLLHDGSSEKQTKVSQSSLKSPMGGSVAELTKKSPSHSISSTTSSGSCQVIKSPAKDSQQTQAVATSSSTSAQQIKAEAPEAVAVAVAAVAAAVKGKPKPDSISEDERSEVRYSSSGYYESPHDEDDEEQVTTTCKARRLRHEDNKRRKTSMKLDIEKENMRALTSPIKKAAAGKQQSLQSPEQHSAAGALENGSPSKIKRFRPKIRRQLRKSSREDVLAAAVARRTRPTIYGLSSASGDTELLLDASMTTTLGPSPRPSIVPTTAAITTETTTTTVMGAAPPPPQAQEQEQLKKPHSCATPTSLLSPKLPTVSSTQSKSTSEATFQLKAKSIESLRSVSPGSDSVFYSEADGTAASATDQGHCHHCGKEMEGKQQELAGDSVESIPYIEQEADIVKPPSDFADSPVTTKPHSGCTRKWTSVSDPRSAITLARGAGTTRPARRTSEPRARSAVELPACPILLFCVRPALVPVSCPISTRNRTIISSTRATTTRADTPASRTMISGRSWIISVSDSQPVGAMIMAKHTVDLCPVDIGKPFAFKVDAGEGIPMYVAADSDDLANRWLNLLRQAASQDNQWLDKSARCLYQAPTSIQRPDCFGYLLKLGSRWCGWSKRYCVLKDACLYFYQDANSKSAFGMACLHGYKVASMSTNASGKKNSFEIIPPETKLRHYYFCTESEMDKKRWISALEYSIDRWIKSG
ncbi:GL18675 [Drosophila persimilis]|uniref:GL18675 n=1 Tax=Drosophila persimilis TaxID=7234 RepID=B4G9C2_DROPE|nr:GL18675 [Drosophila persimilis]